MRQAGILAAAGLISLEEMPKRLSRIMTMRSGVAAGLAAIPGVTVSPVQTNIVIFDLQHLTSTELSSQLKARGVLANGVGPRSMRMVTHYDVTSAQCDEAVRSVAEIVNATTPALVQSAH